jgi:glycosyltransferase EpsD
LGVKEDIKILLSIGELSKRKNHTIAINSVKILLDQGYKLIYLIAGDGPLKRKLTNQIEKLKISNNVFLLGYRKDIPELISISDLVVSTSKQEGLPINILEALHLNKIVLMSKVRGHIDISSGLLDEMLFLNNSFSLYEKLKIIMSSYTLYQEKVNYYSSVIQKFKLEHLINKYDELYLNELK